MFDDEHVQLCQYDMSLDVSNSYDYVQDTSRFGERTTAEKAESVQTSGNCRAQDAATGPARQIPLLSNVAYRRGPDGGVIPTSHNAAYGLAVNKAPDHEASDTPSPAAGDLHTAATEAGRPQGREALSSGAGVVPLGGVRNPAFFEEEIPTARKRVYGPTVKFDDDEMEHSYQNVHIERPP